ncbi:MAG TPA: polyprenyl synthetase family protein [Chitinophagaceae bacterium]
MQLEVPVKEFLSKEIEDYLLEVDRHLRPYMLKAVKRIPKVSPLHDGVAFQIGTGGKRVRAALSVTACAMFCGSMMRAMNFATSIEHLQNFMLDHDDIADGDEERRAREAIWKKYGIAHGINIGDAFITLGAYSILESPYPPKLKLKLIELICEFGIEIAEGQSLDINLKANDAPTHDEYVECTKKKTGAFLAMATVGGALIGGAHKRHLQALREFAIAAGVAFQLKDDIIDYTGAKGRTRGSDIREGKRTLLVIHAAQNCTRREREKLFQILNRHRNATTDNDILWVFDLFDRSDAVDYAEDVARTMIEESIESLAMIPGSEAKDMLFKISSFISQRTR